jgi:2-oxo-3-hexenedioate decarboxylase
MPSFDPTAIAREVAAAYSTRQVISVPFSARDVGFDLPAAYAVQAELARLRRASGRTTVGRKVGFANKALWRALKLETLVWAHMYDDTVRYARDGAASLPLEHMYSPKIEPEIVFKLKKPLGAGVSDPAAVLEAVDWLALGFEIVDCVFPDWKFQPIDFVAAFGLHVALIVGEPLPARAEHIPMLVEALPRFKVSSGKNSLRSPALCLGELAAAIARRPAAEPLAAGELISSGSLTEAKPIVAGEAWTAVVDGLDVPALTLRV